MSRKLAILTVVGVVCAMTWSAGPTWAADTPDVNETLGLSDSTVTSLVVMEHEGGTVTVDIPAEGMHLELERYSMRADDFRLLQDGEEVAAPAPRTYKGNVFIGDESVGEVGGSLIDGQLTATIAMVNGKLFFVQPLSDAVADASLEEHVLYYGEDVLPTEGRCAGGIVPDGHRVLDSKDRVGGTRSVLETGEIQVDVAFDTDRTFWLQNGQSVENTMIDIEYVMVGVEIVYERDVDLTFEITVIHVNTIPAEDPYVTGDPEALLNILRDTWSVEPYTWVRRDQVHLMLGRDMWGGTLGIAWLGTVCDAPAELGYGISQSRSQPAYNGRVTLTAHEMGHNWSATHCDGNGDCHIMCSFLGSCNGIGSPNFGFLAVNEINGYESTADCLWPDAGTVADPIALPFFDDVETGGTGLDEAKWIYSAGGVSSANGVNEPSGERSLNLDSKADHPWRQDEVRTNFILLGGESEVDVSYYSEHRGVEAGKELILEYWSEDLKWVEIDRVTSDGVDQDDYDFHSQTLTNGASPDAFHDEFRLRFRVEGDAFNDDWFIDDILVGELAGCAEDLDGSGAVDFGDILAVLAAWGNAGGPEDLDGSGTVDFGDLLAVLAAWGPC